MALKDKLVTLEDLQAVYTKIVQMVGGDGMWNDITGTLAWNTGKAVGHDLDNNCYAWGAAYASASPQCRYAEITDLTFGDRYRITGWCIHNSQSPVKALYLFLDSSGNLMDYGMPDYSGTAKKSIYGQYHFNSCIVTVPKTAAKLIVLNWCKEIDVNKDLSDIIVEKEVTA